MSRRPNVWQPHQILMEQQNPQRCWGTVTSQWWRQFRNNIGCQDRNGVRVLLSNVQQVTARRKKCREATDPFAELGNALHDPLSDEGNGAVVRRIDGRHNHYELRSLSS